MTGEVPRASDAATGAVIADRLRVADTHWARLRGLLGTRALAAGEALWIVPSRQVHMLGMRYAIDVAFLDDAGAVVRTVPELAPWRISPAVENAASALELPAGALARYGIDVGSRIVIDGAPAASAARAGGLGVLLVNLLLAVFYLRLAVAQLAAWRLSGQPVSLAVLVQYAMLAALILGRRPAAAVSARPLDWVAAVMGTLLPLMVRPAPGPLADVGRLVQVAGVVVTLVVLVFLGRSFGIVAANRGVQTGGPYALVRHPFYAGEVLRWIGYLVAQGTVRNAVVVAAMLATIALRTSAEERLLADDPAYRGYQARVRWRFVPFVI